ncbi:nucleoside triphosphate pyrophosphohydrolase ham1 [Coniosporium tulheliwenetii]|uniref:Nucleoside triphosphate pyrophosphohydrolase ham1 n=1 Tax=Coniosporium tulheliwenetii TaxID=3383036 RepID=A0ACC2Z5A3_9PEZI|nr:nucleoside triphosphate pyrophosphohydrolase ham1 [Cladosporium sp. JES 115]
MAPKELNFITGNKNKLAEVRAILEDTGVELKSQAIDLVEVQGTVEEVTADKCRRAAEAVGGPVLVEDTCLCFKAMKDLPGPYIKWFMLALGPHELHKMLDGFEDKSTQAVCTFAYCEGPGHEPIIFQGRTDVSLQLRTVVVRVIHTSQGKLVPSRGSTVFGWDSCFEYEGQTYAEMDKAEKNKISHRGKALEKLKAWLASHVPE